MKKNILVLGLLLPILLNAQTFEMVKDINPYGPSYPTFSAPFIEYNGKLYFSADDSTTNTELWVTDGTNIGTQVLKEINPTGASYPLGLTLYNGLLYFSASNGALTPQLWSTDGTMTNTKQITSILPRLEFDETIIYNGKMLINAGELWQSDGTDTGTILLSSVQVGGSGFYDKGWFTNYNNKVFFTADNGSNEEFWVTDGTDTGTKMVKDINPNGDSSPHGYIEYNGLLYFAAEDSTFINRELFVSDGTSAGTILFKDINPNGRAAPENFYKYNGKLYFTADDGVHGIELWVTDGTSSGTNMVKDLSLGDSSPHSLVGYNGMLYFVAKDGTQMFLWKTDGTTAGTRKVKYLALSSTQYSLPTAVYNDILYFVSTKDSFGRVLWRTDGTNSGTYNINPIGSSPSDGLTYPLFLATSLTQLDGSLYFAANFNSNDRELWKLTTWPLEISELKNKLPFTIFPNPGNNLLNIRTKDLVLEVNIFDQLGRKLKAIKNTDQVNTSNLSNGSYYIQVKTKNGVGVQSFIKSD